MYKLLIAFACSCILFSCTKHDIRPVIDPAANLPDTAAFTAKINGADFVAQAMGGDTINTPIGAILQCQSWMLSTNQQIFITLYGYHNQPGTFQLTENIGDSTRNIAHYVDRNHSIYAEAKSGIVTIVDLTPTLIRGTFGFVTTDSTYISGQFAFKPLH
jgi:hypothetical protein